MDWDSTVESLTSARVPGTPPSPCAAHPDDEGGLGAECGFGLSRRSIRELAARHDLTSLGVAEVVLRVVEGDALQVPREDAAVAFVRDLGARRAWATQLERLWTQCTTLAVSDALRVAARDAFAPATPFGHEHCALVQAHRLFSLCQVAGVSLERALSASTDEARAVLDALDTESAGSPGATSWPNARAKSQRRPWSTRA